MKRSFPPILRWLALAIPPLFAVLGPMSYAAATELTLMTYNLRLDIASDGPNQWTHRREQVVQQIKFLRPDALGIQEGLYPQVAYLDEQLPGYRYVGAGRDDGDKAGEFSALFYRPDRAEVIDASTFWLSETPDEPSFGWGATFRRVCTYAHFRDRESGQTYWIFNTHFDHQAEAARRNGAKLILERIAQLAGPDEPSFLMGDLNSTPEQEPVRIIAQAMDDAHDLASGARFGPEATFNDFDPSSAPSRRIDYIWISRNNVSVEDYAVISELVDQRYLSDHFPVIARVRFGEGSKRAPAKLVVSPDRHHLQTGDGKPFFWLGDTAWELFHRLTLEEAKRYLQTRASQGFTVVQAVALAELDGLSTPNAYGELPLVDNDPARPNEAYFRRVDAIVKTANELGIVVGLLPTWGDKFNKKWGVGPEIFTPDNALAFGRYMGRRYSDASIIWILGGDRSP